MDSELLYPLFGRKQVPGCPAQQEQNACSVHLETPNGSHNRMDSALEKRNVLCWDDGTFNATCPNQSWLPQWWA